MRYTRKLIQGNFEYFCECVGLVVAKSYNDVGCVRLDKNIGGYNIELIISKTGAVTHPFDDTRRNAKELLSFFHSITTFQAHKKQNAKLFKEA
jgi:hypothetical protein